MDLDDLALFCRIVDLGTLSAVARERNVPVSQVTRALARLEARCQARLLHRNTHGQSLTDEGDTVLAHARRLLEGADELQADLALKRAGPSGWVRVSVSPIVAVTVLVPSLPLLRERHPHLHLDIAADDRMSDLVRDGIDVALRTGTPASDALVAQRIGSLTRRLYASAGYAAAHGLPDTPEALAGHRLVANTTQPALNRWPLGRGEQRRVHVVRGDVRTDNTAVVLELVRQGLGIGRITDIAAAPLLARGELVPVLADWAVEPPVPVYAVMLQERHRLPKVHACVEYWAAWLATHTAAAPSAAG